MAINKTLNYLMAKRAETLLCFSASVTTLSTYLNGSGGQAGDGFPTPKNCRLYRLDCWDGSQLVSATGNVPASQGDRISVYATYNGLSFDVEVRVNGISTTLIALGANANATLYATVHLQMI